MGHNISAIVCRPSAAIEQIREFDLPIIRAGEFVIIPMDPHHFDAWSERLGLGLDDGRSKVLLDGPLAHHVAAIASQGDYALIETDYFGGKGAQVAAVYRKGEEAPLLASERVPGEAINAALRAIGVVARPGTDEFATLGLGHYRDFVEFFGQYYR